MASAKAYEFPVSVRWAGGRVVRAAAAGKPELEVATPPEFKGGVERVWSPEDLLVVSAASCYTVTLAAVAERRGVPLRSLEVSGSGRVTQRPDGRFGFTRIDLDVTLETEPGCQEEARNAAEAAERGCLVAVSLDLPVRLSLDVCTVPAVSAA